MDEDDKKILHDLVFKELRSGLKLFANARTLAEMKEEAAKQNASYWKNLFRLLEELQ